MASATVEAIQRALKARGHDLGRSGPRRDGIDGVLGSDLERSLTLKAVLAELRAGVAPALRPQPPAPPARAGGFVFGERSLRALKGVHPDLVKVASRAIALSDVDFMVIEGVRTPARQRELFAKGRTTAQLRAVGIRDLQGKPSEAKVTWTLKSNHFVQADGFGHAIDCLPAPFDWKEAKPFDRMAMAMFAAASELRIPIRWGADWDRDGRPRERGESDSPHFELWR